MVCTLMRGRFLLCAVNWIAVDARTRIMKGATHLGHALASGRAYALREVLNLVDHL